MERCKATIRLNGCEIRCERMGAAHDGRHSFTWQVSEYVRDGLAWDIDDEGKVIFDLSSKLAPELFEWIDEGVNLQEEPGNSDDVPF